MLVRYLLCETLIKLHLRASKRRLKGLRTSCGLTRPHLQCRRVAILVDTGPFARSAVRP